MIRFPTTTRRTGDHGVGILPAIRHGLEARATGFTLMELIAVLLIVAVVLAMAAPSLRGFAEGRQSADAAASMLALMQWAQTQAISEGREYRFTLDAEAGQYYVTVREGGAFVHPGVDLGRAFALPAGAEAIWDHPAGAGAVHHITFDPTGRADPATIRIVGRLGTTYQLLTARTPTEPFRIVEGAEPVERDEMIGRAPPDRFDRAERGRWR